MLHVCGQLQERYDRDFVKEVYSAPLLSSAEAVNGEKPEEKTVRVQYNSKDEFKRFAKALGIMDDFKVGPCHFPPALCVWRGEDRGDVVGGGGWLRTFIQLLDPMQAP